MRALRAPTIDDPVPVGAVPRVRGGDALREHVTHAGAFDDFDSHTGIVGVVEIGDHVADLVDGAGDGGVHLVSVAATRACRMRGDAKGGRLAARDRAWPASVDGHDGNKTRNSCRPNGLACSCAKVRRPSCAPAISGRAGGERRVECSAARAGRGALIVTGLMAHACAAGAARDAVPLGYVVIVEDDACATRDLDTADGNIAPHEVLHRASLAALGDTFADVLTTDQVLTLNVV